MPSPIIVVDEEGQRYGPYSPDVAKELLATGIVWRDWRGIYRIEKKHVGVVELNPHIAVCDFCTCRPIVFDCDVEDFDHADPNNLLAPEWTSVGGFTACETCGILIQLGDRAGLLRRAFAGYLRRNPGMPADVQARVHTGVAKLHAKFWQHFKGIKPYSA